MQVEVRATVNLPGLRCGQVAIVDDDIAYIKECLAASKMVPTNRVRTDGK